MSSLGKVPDSVRQPLLGAELTPVQGAGQKSATAISQRMQSVSSDLSRAESPAPRQSPQDLRPTDYKGLADKLSQLDAERPFFAKVLNFFGSTFTQFVKKFCDEGSSTMKLCNLALTSENAKIDYATRVLENKFSNQGTEFERTPRQRVDEGLAALKNDEEVAKSRAEDARKQLEHPQDSSSPQELTPHHEPEPGESYMEGDSLGASHS